MKKLLLLVCLLPSLCLGQVVSKGHQKYNYLDGRVSADTTPARNKGKNILVVGDSFCNDGNELKEAIEAVVTADKVYKSCVPGIQLSAILTNAQAFMANSANWVGGKRPDILIIRGGVNDVNTGNSATTMTGRINSLITFARTAQLIPVVLTPPPYKTNSGWSAGEQTEYDSYMTSLLARSDIIVVDTYTLLEDDAVADTLLPAYDGGDGLHPNSTGYAAMATLINTSITSLQNKLTN